MSWCTSSTTVRRHTFSLGVDVESGTNRVHAGKHRDVSRSDRSKMGLVPSVRVHHESRRALQPSPTRKVALRLYQNHQLLPRHLSHTHTTTHKIYYHTHSLVRQPHHGQPLPALEPRGAPTLAQGGERGVPAGGAPLQPARPPALAVLPESRVLLLPGHRHVGRAHAGDPVHRRGRDGRVVVGPRGARRLGGHAGGEDRSRHGQHPGAGRAERHLCGVPPRAVPGAGRGVDPRGPPVHSDPVCMRETD